jgi:hypothetical protein
MVYRQPYEQPERSITYGPFPARGRLALAGLLLFLASLAIRAPEKQHIVCQVSARSDTGCTVGGVALRRPAMFDVRIARSARADSREYGDMVIVDVDGREVHSLEVTPDEARRLGALFAPLLAPGARGEVAVELTGDRTVLFLGLCAGLFGVLALLSAIHGGRLRIRVLGDGRTFIVRGRQVVADDVIDVQVFWHRPGLGHLILVSKSGTVDLDAQPRGGWAAHRRAAASLREAVGLPSLLPDQQAARDTIDRKYAPVRLGRAEAIVAATLLGPICGSLWFAVSHDTQFSDAPGKVVAALAAWTVGAVLLAILLTSRRSAR